MTERSDLERALVAWFDEGPRTMPDRVIDVVADRIGRQRQRRAWRLPWRPTMTPTFKLAAAVAAALVIAFTGWTLLPKQTTVGPSSSPTAAPQSTQQSPAPAASPSASSTYPCAGNSSGCTGPLSAGVHRSANFAVPFALTVPAGWVNDRDIGRTYGIFQSDAPGGENVNHVEVLAKVAIAEQTDRCDPIVKQDVGHSEDAVVGYVKSHPGLVSTAPLPIVIDGHAGQQIDFTVALTWGKSCTNTRNPGDPVVLLLTDTGSPPQRVLGYSTDLHVRWNVVDVNGETVIIECVTPKTGFDALLQTEQQIAGTIDFQ